MEFRQLNTFITVAKLNNFTKAAEELGYTQPTVTSQIQLLESELGVQLFERIRKNISLTYEGNQFLNYAKQIIELSESAKLAVKKSTNLKGVIRIGAWESLCTTRVHRLLSKFHERYPDTEIMLKTVTATDYKESLLNNEIDIAFCLEPSITVEDFVVELSIPEPLALLVGPNHPLATIKSVYPKDIANHLLILAEEDCSYRKTIVSSLSNEGLAPKSIMEIYSIQATKELAMCGTGITLLPKITVEKELLEGKLVELHWLGSAFEFFTQLVYHEDKWLSPALKKIIDISNEIFLKQ